MKKKLANMLFFALLILGAVVITLPFFYAISTSLKQNHQVFAVPMQWIPDPVVWENYIIPFQQRPLGRYFLNSVLVSTSVTVLNVITCSMAGYSFAKFDYMGRDFFFMAVLATLMVPIQVIVIPLFILVESLGWLNSYAGLIIPSATSAFGIFLMRQYFQTVPKELMEAARIDGCGELRIFWQIVMPLVRPALSALIIFIFMHNWNNFLWPLLVATKEEMMTLPLGIAKFESTYSTHYPQLMAVSMSATLPVLLVFVILQRQFIQGIALSGIKQ